MSNILIFILLTLIFSVAFIYLKRKQPATIWLGLTFISSILTFKTLILMFFIESDYLFSLGKFLSWLVFVLFFIALFIVGLFIFNGVKLIRLEGFEFGNSLSLLTGTSSLLYLVLWPILFDLTKEGWLNTLYRFISLVIIYVAFIFFLYSLSNLLNLIHFNRTPIDYFIVLGAALNGAEVSPILASRIDKAIELQVRQNSGKLLFTGGQGTDELISEGKAMAQYAYDQGVCSDLILKEINSTNTAENIRLSQAIIEADWDRNRPPTLAIVTNNYHVLRALMTAKSQGLNCIGYGSFSKFYYSLNAFLREYVAYLQMTYKVHVFMVFVFGIGLAIFK